MSESRNRILVIAALGAVWFIWGSTYLGIRFGLEGFPPLLMGGIRFLIAGPALYALLRWRGVPAPTRVQWWNTGRAGVLMLVGGVGLVSMAQNNGVGSGLAATAVAIIPVWAALVSGFFGSWPRRMEWLGLAVGLVGVLVLVQEGDFQASPLGLVLIIIAPILWAIGSVWGTRKDMPAPLMAAAAELTVAGVVMTPIGLLAGERFEAVPSLSSVLALAYLIVFGSMIAYTAYVFLLGNTRPAMATSYAYVNPAVAVLLGVTLGAEVVTGEIYLALPIILAGVAIVTFAQRGSTDDEPGHDAPDREPPLSAGQPAPTVADAS